MDKVHYCERFLELLVDLEVGNFCPTYSYCVPEIHILEIFLLFEVF